MGLNIKNAAAEKLAAQVARLAGETKTEAIRKALEERKQRLELVHPNRKDELMLFLQDHIWPKIPKSALGKRLSKQQRERILGYGKYGV